MRSDSEIKTDVEEELGYDPDIEQSHIGVTVNDGVVSLTGFVRSCSKKVEAEADAKRVHGVLGVANNIQVRLPSIDSRPDPDIARDVISEMQLDLTSSYAQIRPVVAKGWVTLEGNAEWHFERERAEAAARRVRGILGVTNSIRLEPRVSAGEIKHKIEKAFRRSAQVNAQNVHVAVNGSEVELKGSVYSWAERDEAQRAAWLAPGVTHVDNQITINP